MTLRSDEMFVLGKLEEHFTGSQPVSSRPGEDPPDAYFKIGEQTVAVEITQLSPIILRADGSVENRLSQDVFGERLLDEMDAALRSKLTNSAILVHLRTPVARPKRFKDALRKLLESFALGNELPKEWCEFEVDDEKIWLVAIDPASADGKQVIGVVENKNASADIGENAAAILANRLEIKERKCADLDWRGERWLVLLNMYWLADEQTYHLAYRNIRASHGFSKILLVNEKGAVHILYSRT